MTNNMFLPVVVILLAVCGAAQCSCAICTDIKHFNHLIEINAALQSSFKIFTDFGFLRCVQQCMFRARCQSINFDISKKMCWLNKKSTSNPVVKQQSIFTDVLKWPKTLARQCENHNCPYNSTCTIQEDGSTKCITEQGKSPVDDGYILATINTSSFFYKPYLEEIDFASASNICKQDKGHLIETDSAVKNDFITSVGIDLKIKYLFIGASDKEKEGEWKWEYTGMKIDFPIWNPLEPNNVGDEDCAILKPATGAWSDVKCSSSHNFICEIPYTV